MNSTDSSESPKPSKKKQKQQNPVVVPKTVTDIQRIKLERLMQDPEKPVLIPDRKKDKKVHEAPEFVRNVMGSSAGAGSGEFHVYRHLRRKEYARQKFITEKAKKDEQDDEYHKRIEENKQKAEEKTAKKRAKRPAFLVPIVISDNHLEAMVMPHMAQSYIPLQVWKTIGCPKDSIKVRAGIESFPRTIQLGDTAPFLAKFKLSQGNHILLGLDIMKAAKVAIDFVTCVMSVSKTITPISEEPGQESQLVTVIYREDTLKVTPSSPLTKSNDNSPVENAVKSETVACLERNRGASHESHTEASLENITENSAISLPDLYLSSDDEPAVKEIPQTTKDLPVETHRENKRNKYSDKSPEPPEGRSTERGSRNRRVLLPPSSAQNNSSRNRHSRGSRAKNDFSRKSLSRSSNSRDIETNQKRRKVLLPHLPDRISDAPYLEIQGPESTQLTMNKVLLPFPEQNRPVLLPTPGKAAILGAPPDDCILPFEEPEIELIYSRQGPTSALLSTPEQFEDEYMPPFNGSNMEHFSGYGSGPALLQTPVPFADSFIPPFEELQSECFSSYGSSTALLETPVYSRKWSSDTQCNHCYGYGHRSGDCPHVYY